jgi:1,4-alpha-glucan branching enzyme
MELELNRDEVHLLITGSHQNPHQFLGLHESLFGEKVIRIWAPKKSELFFEYLGEIVKATLADPEGLFVYYVPKSTTNLDYRIFHLDGSLDYDPYSFIPTLSFVDAHLFHRGIHYQIYDVLGAHPIEHQGVVGVKFAVWAPNASRVSLMADCNHWKQHVHPMRKIGESGLWEIFIPGKREGMLYKFAIRTAYGHVFFKTDPYANQFELRPNTAAIVTDTNHFTFRDHEWMQKRTRVNQLDGPMNIYEVHLGSWMKKGDQFLNYKELASELVPYMKEMGYTHVELMPIMEHPLDESWGYQTTGYFAPTSRYGSFEDFQYFVNHLHMHHLGVILDWSPGHFPDDEFALSYFDGSHLYEKDHPVMGRHPEWHTRIFNYGRKEVSNFLIASALFWFEKTHVDGLRVDAVQSMLYLDYGRRGGYWIPNAVGGKENLDAIEFMKHLNSIVHQKFPGVLMIAEDASLFEGVTRPLEWNGLGFDMKWSIGWMNDTLTFMKKDPIYRKHHMDDLTRSFCYGFSERYLLPISHDEVVHGKGALFEKMPLDEWDKFSQMRLYYSAALAHPGKNLFFMGYELAEWREWNCKGRLDWDLLSDPNRRKWKRFVREMNHFYLQNPSLWQIDFDHKGFAWIDYKDYNHSVISYIRQGISSKLVCVHNYTKSAFDEYIIRLPNVSSVKEVLNSDDERYGGSGRVNREIYVTHDRSGFCIKMPALATMFFEVWFEGEDEGRVC